MSARGPDTTPGGAEGPHGRPAAGASPGLSSHVVLFDETCGFCRWSLGLLLAWDRRQRLRPVALSQPEADELLAWVPRGERMESWHLVRPDGSVVSAGPAGAHLLRLLPGGRGPAWLLDRLPRVTARTYRWIAGHRHRLRWMWTRRGLERGRRLIAERGGDPGPPPS